MAGTDGKLCPRRRRIVDCAKLSTLRTYQLTPLSKECQNNCRKRGGFKVNYFTSISLVIVISSFGVRTPPTPKIDVSDQKAEHMPTSTS